MGSPPALTFGILGSLSIHRGTQEVSLGSPHQRRVLAALLVARRAVPPDELIDILWGERPPASAQGTLHTHISRLRTALGAGSDLVTRDASGYRLGVDPAAVDAVRFERLLTEGADAARAGRAEEAAGLLSEARGQWRGPALLDFRYEPFAQTEIARLEALRLTALEQHITVELACGRPEVACRELEAVVADHPLHEDLHALLMVALYRSGRQADALAVYADLRRTLRDELGLEPTPKLRALEHDILDHAASLTVGEPPSEIASAAPTRSAHAEELHRRIEAIGVPALDDKMTCELLLARGDGQRRSGKVPDARRSFAAAVRLATSTGSPDQLAAGALGLAGPPEDTMLGEPLDESLLQQAIRALPHNRPAVTMLRARLAIALIDRGDTARGQAMAEAAVTFARSAGEPQPLAYALRARHRTWFDPGALTERLALDTELIDLGRRLDDPDVLAWGHRWRCIDLLETGELDAYAHELDVLEGLATQLHDAFHWWGVIIRRAGLALLTGPPDKAEPLVLEGLGLADQIGSPYTMAASLNALWALRWHQGRLDEIAGPVLTIGDLSPVHKFLLPYLHRELGRREQAALAYAALDPDDFAALLTGGSTGVTHLFGLCLISDVACYLGDTERAPALYAALEPFSGRLAVIHPGLTAVAAVDQPLGQLSGLLGDHRRSEDHFQGALAQCGEIGAPTLGVRAQLAYAEALLARGELTAERRAERLLADAGEAAADLGLPVAARATPGRAR